MRAQLADVSTLLWLHGASLTPPSLPLCPTLFCAATAAAAAVVCVFVCVCRRQTLWVAQGRKMFAWGSGRERVLVTRVAYLTHG